MAQTNTAVKIETVEEKLARIMRENDEMRAQIAKQEQAEVKKAGVFALGYTTQRNPDPSKPNDKGAKGGSLRIMLGKQNVFCSLAMALAIVEHVGEIKSYVEANKDKITR